MKLLQELGERIEHAWRDKNFNYDAFPPICAEALRDARMPEKITPWDIAAWTLRQDALPTQQDLSAGFGQPPITIYNGSRFYVEAYFWLEGTTSVHQHAFCGAFQVLHGSSLHSWYHFDLDERVNQAMELGRLNLKTCEILDVGDVQEITPGRDYIHSLFHLVHPSVTLIVRTYQTVNYLPQFDYRKPGLATDPFYQEQNLIKKLQTAATMVRLGRPEADDLIADWIETSDLYSAFRILVHMRGLLGATILDETFGVERSGDRFGKLLSAARRRHGSRMDLIERVFQDQARVDSIIQKRGYVSDPDQRFFLALLMNIDGRDTILRLIQARFPDADPKDKLLDCIFELSQTRVLGSNLPNALGIADFGDIDLIILELLFDEMPGDSICERIAAETGWDDLEMVARTVAEKLEKIRKSAVLQPLLVK